MNSIVNEELAAAVDDLFWELGDEPNCVLRRYSKGTTQTSSIAGQQGRLPVGSPIEAQAILSWRKGKGQEGKGDLFVKPSALQGNDGLTNPEYEWTVQFDGDGELDLGPERRGANVWQPLGPARNPAMWKAVAIEGGDHRAT